MQTPPSTPPSYPPPVGFEPPQGVPPVAAPPRQNKTLLYVIIGIVVLCLLCVAVGGILVALGVAKLPGMANEIATQMPELEDMMTQVAPVETAAPSDGAMPSQYVKDVILAEDVTEGDMAPVNPTSVFNSDSVIHAVLDVVDAPAGTAFKTVWYVEDVGSEYEANSLISESELETEGTRYVDFSLTPETTWPSGTYRAEVFVNGVLHEVVFFTVQ